jgi:hypothetical protein
MAYFARRGVRADRPVVRPAPSPASLSAPDQSRPSTSAPLINLSYEMGRVQHPVAIGGPLPVFVLVSSPAFGRSGQGRFVRFASR